MACHLSRSPEDFLSPQFRENLSSKNNLCHVIFKFLGSYIIGKVMREQKRFEIEVHVAGISFRKIDDIVEVLVAKRSSKRNLYPNKWECGGGQIYPNENFEDAVKRQLKEELNVDIKVIAPISSYEIEVLDLPQKKIPEIQFACEYIRGEPRVDGQELVDFQWKRINEIEDIDFINGLKDAIYIGVEIFLKNQIVKYLKGR